MIDWALLATGIAVGVAVAAPIGPINLLCIRHTLAYGFFAGILSGTGAVLGDGTFAAVAALGLTTFSQLLQIWTVPLQILGSILLIAMGVRTYFARFDLAQLDQKPPLKQHFATFCTTYVLTITNPATMMGFAVLFGGAGGLVGETATHGRAVTIILAVMAGSLLWWITLARIVSFFRTRLNERHLLMINKITGILIFGFGLVIALKLFGLFGAPAP